MAKRWWQRSPAVLVDRFLYYHMPRNCMTSKLMKLGRTMVNWAYIEGSLDLINAQLAAVDPPQEPFPVSLKRKIAFFRKAIRHEAFNPVREEGLAMVEGVSRFSETRHNLIHGMAALGSGASMNFSRNAYARGAQWAVPEAMNVQVDTAELDHFLSEIEELSDWTLTFAERLPAVLDAHIDDLRRQVADSQRIIAERSGVVPSGE